MQYPSGLSSIIVMHHVDMRRVRGPSLLERPENHHMIRWDNAGEHIIVERPEQLALHVLPSVYRQSRFASFSRQLNVSRRSVCSPDCLGCRAFLLQRMESILWNVMSTC